MWRSENINIHRTEEISVDGEEGGQGVGGGGGGGGSCAGLLALSSHTAARHAPVNMHRYHM